MERMERAAREAEKRTSVYRRIRESERIRRDAAKRNGNQAEEQAAMKRISELDRKIYRTEKSVHESRNEAVPLPYRHRASSECYEVR